SASASSRGQPSRRSRTTRSSERSRSFTSTLVQHREMSRSDVDGLNAGYAHALLDDYLENPEAVPAEWRALFESGDSELVATHPGLARLLERLGSENRHAQPGATAPAPAPEAPPAAAPDLQLLGGVAAAMALG